MELSVFFAGTGGSVPTARRNLPGLLIQAGGERLLVDCGEGIQRQLVRSVGLPELDAVFVTHFHADHWLGLPGMLKTFDMRAREQPLAIYGPPGLRSLMDTMRIVYGRLSYPLSIVELQAGQAVPGTGYTVTPFEVSHRAVAHGYALVERERPGEFDPARARELGVSEGPDFGRLQRGETVEGVSPDQVVGPPRAGRKLVFSGDTAPCEMVSVAAHEANLLVHEATFTAEEAERAAQTAHSTATQAATIGRDARVAMLALTHISTRYGGREIQQEARAVFPAAVVPRDFDAIEVPFPERGEPRLIRWDDNPSRHESARPSAPEERAAGDPGVSERPG